VDDVAILVESESCHTNVHTLEKVLRKADLWAKRHAARFAPDKFEFIHFTNSKLEDIQDDIQDDIQGDIQNNTHTDISEIETAYPQGNDRMPVKINDLWIQPTQSAKYLGVWLDKRLDFNVHRQKLLAKANGSLEALRAMTGSTWGASLMAMRKVYQAMVVPQMLHGVSAWYSPAARAMPAGELRPTVNEFTKIQRRAAILISGAFKSTSAAAVNIELFLLPIHLLMDQLIQESAIRIQTGATWAQPDCIRPTTCERKRGGRRPWKPSGGRKMVLRPKKRRVGNTQSVCHSAMGDTDPMRHRPRCRGCESLA
jgi:hypothetical protein